MSLFCHIYPKVSFMKKVLFKNLIRNTVKIKMLFVWMPFSTSLQATVCLTLN